MRSVNRGEADQDHGQERWRVFAALPVNDAVRERMRDIRDALASRRWPMRWVDPELAHITVKFYGNVPIAALDDLRQRLAEAAGQSRRVSLRTSRIGAFPSENRPRVIWLGLDGVVERLESLSQAVEAASIGYGKPEDRPFRPHITLARLRDREDAPRDFADAARTLRVTPVELAIDRLQLMRSVLGPKGPTYSVVAEWPLGAAAHDPVATTPEVREHG